MVMASPATGPSWQPPGLTLQGWVTALGGVVWGVIAWLTGQRDLIWPGLFLIALPLASWLLLAFGARTPALHRQVTPSEVTAGGEVTSRVKVDNAGFSLGAAAHYRDTHPAALLGTADASLPAGLARHRIDHRLVVAWRGRHLIGPLRRSVTDALGLARAERVLPGTAEVLALPAVHPLEPQPAAAGLGSASDAPVLKTSLVGTDDVLVREYLPGDDVRRIHWRSTARIGELMVRREEQAWDPSAVLLIDNRAAAFGRTESTADHPEPRFEWLVSAAASIAGHLIEHGFAVSITDTATTDPADAHRLGTRAAMRRLAEIELVDQADLTAAVAAAPSGARGQLLVVLLAHLDLADAAVLATADRDHQACWAMIVEPAIIDADALRALETTGWRVLQVPPDTSVADAWHLLGESGR